MKKIVVAILALVFIITSTGVVLQMHYCMGEPAGFGLGTNKPGICSNCGMKESDEKDNGCCKDKHMLIKNTADQKFSEAGSIMIQVFSIALPVNYIQIHSADYLSETVEKPDSHTPLRSSGVAVYIRNCVFLI